MRPALRAPALIALAVCASACGRDFASARTVAERNAPPEILPLGTQEVREGDTLRLVISADDDDGGAPCLFAELSAFNGNATLDTDDGGGQATFIYTPDHLLACEAPCEDRRMLRVVACDPTVCAGLVPTEVLAGGGACVDDQRAELEVAVITRHPFREPDGEDFRGPQVLGLGRYGLRLGDFPAFFGAKIAVHHPQPLTLAGSGSPGERLVPAPGRFAATAPGAARVVVFDAVPVCREVDNAGVGRLCPIDATVGCEATCDLTEAFYDVPRAVAALTAPTEYLQSLSGRSPLFGADIALGDVNGDSVPELFVAAGRSAAPEDGTGEFPAVVCDGRIYVYPSVPGGGYAAEPIELRDPSGTSDCTGFGSSISVADVDADGVADLAVGAPGRFSLQPGCTNGRVWLWLSGDGGTPWDVTPREILPPPDPNGPICEDPMAAGGFSFAHEHPGASFGFSVALLGPPPWLTQGRPGLLAVGAPSAVIAPPAGQGAALLNYGAVQVYNLSRGLRGVTIERQQTPLQNPTAENFALYGFDLAFGYDFFRTFVGASDELSSLEGAFLAVGAPGARVLSGKVVTWPIDVLSGQPTAAPLQFSAPQPSPDAFFGMSVATHTVIGGSLFPASGLIVGAPFETVERRVRAGAAYGIGFVGSSELPAVIVRYEPANPQDDGIFGTDVAGLTEQVLVGAPGADFGGHRADGMVLSYASSAR